MKKFIVIILLFIVSACSSQQFEHYACPEIIIPRETTRAYHSDINDKFQINLVGHETHCYREEADNRYYAVITPIFKLRRLEQSSTTNVDADYFVKTSVNDKDYIGRRVFKQTLSIPRDAKELILRGNTSTTRISNPPFNNFKIYLGMDLAGAKKEKSDKMFDIDYRYFSEDEINAQYETAIDRVNLEILPDEEVIYSEEFQKPIVVKKNRPKNNCQN